MLNPLAKLGLAPKAILKTAKSVMPSGADTLSYTEPKDNYTPSQASQNLVSNDLQKMRLAIGGKPRNDRSLLNKFVGKVGIGTEKAIGGVESRIGGGRITDLRAIDDGSLVPDKNSRLGAYYATKGYERGTVGHSVHNAIGTIYAMLGTAGEEQIGKVFNSPEAKALYDHKVTSSSSRKIASMEVDYWKKMRKEKGSFGGHLGSVFNPTARDWLQKQMFQ